MLCCVCYTGGILQRLDTDVHNAVTAKTSTALWQRRRARHCDSENEHGAVTAMVRIVMLQRWQWQRWDISGWHRCDSDVYISVTAMATDTTVTAVTTDSAVSAVAADTTVTAMFTLVWQRWQLTVLWQRWKQTALSERWQLTALWQQCIH